MPQPPVKDFMRNGRRSSARASKAHIYIYIHGIGHGIGSPKAHIYIYMHGIRHGIWKTDTQVFVFQTKADFRDGRAFNLGPYWGNLWARCSHLGACRVHFGAKLGLHTEIQTASIQRTCLLNAHGISTVYPRGTKKCILRARAVYTHFISARNTPYRTHL